MLYFYFLKLITMVEIKDSIYLSKLCEYSKQIDESGYFGKLITKRKGRAIGVLLENLERNNDRDSFLQVLGCKRGDPYTYVFKMFDLSKEVSYKATERFKDIPSRSHSEFLNDLNFLISTRINNLINEGIQLKILKTIDDYLNKYL